MANNLTAVIGADTTRFNESISKARTVLQSYKTEAENASKSIKTNTSVTNSQVASYERVVKSLEKVNSGTMTTEQAQKSLAKQIKELKIQWQNLSDTAKNSDFGKALSNSCKTAEAELKRLQQQMKSVEETKKKMDSVKGKFNDVMGAAGLGNFVNPYTAALAGVTALVGTIKHGIEVNKEFEFAQSKLQAVTGKSAEELAGLTEQAKTLGATTKYTASEISGLQLELAKLGFDPKEIEQMTQHVQNFATAVDTDLSSAASLAGAALRMFGLSAEETQRVADVLSSGCTNSALSFEYLNTALSAVGPVASAFGFSIEDTTALLGQLANAGFDASTAATSTRSILLNLADANGKLAQALGHPVKSGKELFQAFEELQRKGIDLNEALGLTDKMSVAAFESFLKTASSGIELTDSMYNCTGAAQKMSDVMSDNLEGDLASLGSAWDGLMMSFGGGNDVIRSVVQAFTYLISKTTETIKAITEWATNLYNNSMVVRGIVEAIKLSFKNAFEGIVTIVKTAVNDIAGFFKIIGKVLEGDFSGAVDEWKKMLGKRADLLDQHVKKVKKNMSDAIDNTVNGKIEVSTSTTSTSKTPSATPSPTTTNTPSKTGGTTSGTKSGGKSGKKDEPKFTDGSLSDLEHKLSELKSKYKDGLIQITPDDYKQQVDELEAQIKSKKVELGLLVEADENSLKAIEEKISAKQSELKLAIDDESRYKIQQEINELTGKKEVIELKLKPVVSANDVDKFVSDIADYTNKKSTQSNQPQPKQSGVAGKAQSATSDADRLKADLDFNQQLIRTYKDQYKAIQEKVKAGGQLNDNEARLNNLYEEAISNVNELSDAYANAASNAALLQNKAQLKAKTWQGFKKGVGAVGDLNGAVMGFGSTWGNLTEQWDDMSAFEKVTSAIDATISSIESAISVYESITEMIQLFGEISQLASEKKIAANTAEMASDTAKTVQDTANTQTEIANNTAEQASDMGKLGVKEATAIASATASGASMPFPANIAAIAAGIAAVVAGFAMVFSCFADGGIVGGQTTIGDYNLARVNKGEMILNGTQQKRLFSILDGAQQSGSTIGSGSVQFKIKGQALKGVLKNYDKKMGRV